MTSMPEYSGSRCYFLTQFAFRLGMHVHVFTVFAHMYTLSLSCQAMDHFVCARAHGDVLAHVDLEQNRGASNHNKKIFEVIGGLVYF